MASAHPKGKIVTPRPEDGATKGKSSSRSPPTIKISLAVAQSSGVSSARHPKVSHEQSNEVGHEVAETFQYPLDDVPV